MIVRPYESTELQATAHFQQVPSPMQSKDMWSGNDLSFSLRRVLQGVHNSPIACSLSLACPCSYWTSGKHIDPVCSVSLSGSEAQEDKGLTWTNATAGVSKAGARDALVLCLMSRAPEDGLRKMRASYWTHLHSFIPSAAFIPHGWNRGAQLSTSGPDSGLLAVLGIEPKSFQSLA